MKTAKGFQTDDGKLFAKAGEAQRHEFKSIIGNAFPALQTPTTTPGKPTGPSLAEQIADVLVTHKDAMLTALKFKDAGERKKREKKFVAAIAPAASEAKAA